MSEAEKTLLFSPDFLEELGRFHGGWSSIEMQADHAIGHFLEITPEQTHLLTSGMMFGRKAQFLAGLISRSDHKYKAKLLGALNQLRGEVRRDWLAHSYMGSTSETVTFLHRNTGGEYKVNKLTFTLAEFRKHVHDMLEAGAAFSKSMGFDDNEAIEKFIAAAERAQNKS